MKIAVFSAKSYDRETLASASKDDLIEFDFFSHRLSLHTIRSAKSYDGVCLFVNDDADRQVVEKLADYGVRVIALRCSGYNNVDLYAADECGIKVFRVPAYSPQAVAEHAVALILTLNRKTHRAYNRVREGNFELEGLMGFDLHTKTVGVVGTGMIGCAFASIMRGFGCRVIAFDPFPNNTFSEENGVTYCDRDELLKQSDIISLHCPLLDDTKHLIDQEAYSKMKPGVMLINTGRGGLVDTKDTINALKSGKLGYLGIDVYEEESELFFEDRSSEIIQDDVIVRLMGFPNVLVTGHQGFFTRDALDAIANVTVENLIRFGSNLSPLPNREIVSETLVSDQLPCNQ